MYIFYDIICVYYVYMFLLWDRRDRDRMVVGFITNYAISSYHHYRCEFESCSGEVYSIQHYVIKFVNDLRQVSGFIRYSGFLTQ